MIHCAFSSSSSFSSFFWGVGKRHRRRRRQKTLGCSVGGGTENTAPHKDRKDRCRKRAPRQQKKPCPKRGRARLTVQCAVALPTPDPRAHAAHPSANTTHRDGGADCVAHFGDGGILDLLDLGDPLDPARHRGDRGRNRGDGDVDAADGALERSNLGLQRLSKHTHKHTHTNQQQHNEQRTATPQPATQPCSHPECDTRQWNARTRHLARVRTASSTRQLEAAVTLHLDLDDQECHVGAGVVAVLVPCGRRRGGRRGGRLVTGIGHNIGFQAPVSIHQSATTHSNHP